jgi:hypothetical protein
MIDPRDAVLWASHRRPKFDHIWRDRAPELQRFASLADIEPGKRARRPIAYV